MRGSGSGLILPSRIRDPRSAWLWGTTSHTSHFLTSISGWGWGRGWAWGWGCAWGWASLVSLCEEGGLTGRGIRLGMGQSECALFWSRRSKHWP